VVVSVEIVVLSGWLCTVEDLKLLEQSQHQEQPQRQWEEQFVRCYYYSAAAVVVVVMGYRDSQVAGAESPGVVAPAPSRPNNTRKGTEMDGGLLAGFRLGESRRLEGLAGRGA